MPENPNPQGKGLTPSLDALMMCQPTNVSPKLPRVLLAEYFTSLLVLSADFGFRIVPGQTYYLYLREGAWKLSLIAPEQWHSARRGHAIGTCSLQSDMTWRLKLNPSLAQIPEVLQAIDDFKQGFIEMLEQSSTLEESLPTYAANLPFYPRVLAAGLAKSLRRSIELAGLSGRQGWARLVVWPSAFDTELVHLEPEAGEPMVTLTQ